MTLSISSAFDGGNIRLVAIQGNRIDLEIAADNASDFYQWFSFRLSGAAGQAVELRLLNCAGAAHPPGGRGYRAGRRPARAGPRGGEAPHPQLRRRRLPARLGELPRLHVGRPRRLAAG